MTSKRLDDLRRLLGGSCPACGAYPLEWGGGLVFSAKPVRWYQAQIAGYECAKCRTPLRKTGRAPMLAWWLALIALTNFVPLPRAWHFAALSFLFVVGPILILRMGYERREGTDENRPTD